MPRPISLTVVNGVRHDEHTLIQIAKATGMPVSAFPKEGHHIEGSASPNFEVAYLDRFNALYEGLLFLLENTPLDEVVFSSELKAKTLETFHVLRNDYSRAIKAIKEINHITPYKETLYEYSRTLLTTLEKVLGVSERTATTWLSKAEEFALLLKERPDLMTLSEIEMEGTPYLILEREKPLPCLSAQIKKDLMAIKHLTPGHEIPLWYQHMTPLEKRFLRQILDKVTQEEDLEGLYANPISRLRTIPFIPNFRAHELIVMSRETGEVLFRSKRYASSHVGSRDIETPNELSGESIETRIRDFHTLENLKHTMEVCVEERIQDYLLEKGSGLPNGAHVKLPIPYFVQTLISPEIGVGVAHQPDAGLEKDKQRGLLALRGYCDEVFNKQLLTKTLRTPGGHTKTITVEVDVQPFTLNHPLNYAKLMMYTGSQDMKAQTFTQFVEKFESAWMSAEDKKEIASLLAEYKATIGMGTAYNALIGDMRGRELFLSSLEQLLTEKMKGIPSGSCVSGKDRKAVEMSHTDAMLLFHFFYKKWPTYRKQVMTKDDRDLRLESDFVRFVRVNQLQGEDFGEQKSQYADYLDEMDISHRVNFIKLLSHLLVSGQHHQRSATLNAPGAVGLKTLDLYLPADAVEPVRAEYMMHCPSRGKPIQDEDTLASMNELDAITKLKEVAIKATDQRKPGKKVNFDRYIPRIEEVLSKTASAEKAKLRQRKIKARQLLEAHKNNSKALEEAFTKAFFVDENHLSDLMLIKKITEQESHWYESSGDYVSKGTYWAKKAVSAFFPSDKAVEKPPQYTKEVLAVLTAWNIGAKDDAHQAPKPLPQGIQGIKDVLAKGPLNEDMLGLMYKKLVNRSLEKRSRAKDTYALYTAIKDLYLAQGRDAECEAARYTLRMLSDKICAPERMATSAHELDGRAQNPLFEKRV